MTDDSVPRADPRWCTHVASNPLYGPQAYLRFVICCTPPNFEARKVYKFTTKVALQYRHPCNLTLEDATNEDGTKKDAMKMHQSATCTLWSAPSSAGRVFILDGRHYI